jgi:hypothetical protein
MQNESRIESYRVRSPLLAMSHRDHGPSKFVTIPRGAVVAVNGRPKPFEFVEIDCDGQRFTVHNRDLEEHTERAE